MRKRRREIGRGAEQRICRGQRNRRRAHAGRDTAPRQALRHGRDRPQLGGLRQHRRRPLPDLQPGHGGLRTPVDAHAARARTGNGPGPERRHRLRLLRPWPRQGVGVPLHRHDRQRGVPGGAGLRRVHARRGQDRGADRCCWRTSRTPQTFRRVAEKALRAGKPIIVDKIGQSDAGVRAAASHTAALAGSYAAYRRCSSATASSRAATSTRWSTWRRPSSPGADGCRPGRRVAICTASGGGGGWMADACTAAGLEVPELDADTRGPHRSAPARLRHLAKSGRCHGTSRAQDRLRRACPAGDALADIDGLILVMSARSAENLESDSARPWPAWPRRREKPILLVELHAAGAAIDARS